MKKSWILPLILRLLVALLSIEPIVTSRIAFGWDFHTFYAAGRLPASEIYDLDAQRAAERAIWAESRSHQVDYANFSPYFRPAYYRLLLAPLAKLPYWTAYRLWVTFQAAAFVAAIVLLARRFGFEDSYWLLLPMSPFLWRSLAWGQDVFAVLFVIALALELLARGPQPRRRGRSGSGAGQVERAAARSFGAVGFGAPQALRLVCGRGLPGGGAFPSHHGRRRIPRFPGGLG